MIIDETDDVLHHWEESERHLLIAARPGNGKTSKAKDIMNQMIKEGHSILLLTRERSAWRFGLNKSSMTLIGPYEYILEHPDHDIEIDLLVIHDIRDIGNDFPIESIKYKYILALSDENCQVPDFFNGRRIRLVEWDNISKMIVDDRMMYKALSDDENGTILLSEWSTNHESQVSIKFPVDVLKKLLLE